MCLCVDRYKEMKATGAGEALGIFREEFCILIDASDTNLNTAIT